MFRILIIVAYGQFGRRIAGEPSRDVGVELILAGRNVQALHQCGRDQQASKIE